MISRLAIAVTLISLIFVSPAAAQSETKITGVVRDATGLGIAGATVTVTNRTTRDIQDRDHRAGRQLFHCRCRPAPGIVSRGVSRFSEQHADGRRHGRRAEARSTSRSRRR